MKRILLNAICVTLLVIAGAGILLWARSLVTSEGLFVAHNFHRYALVSGDAAVIYTSGSYQFETSQAKTDFLDGASDALERQWRMQFATDVGGVAQPTDTVLGFGLEQYTWDIMRQ